MKRNINRNLLKHAAGTAIWCPVCENILDHKKTAILTFNHMEIVRCTPCLDQMKVQLGARLANSAVTILDGRTA